jgi:uncharacterized membrane protein YkoI
MKRFIVLASVGLAGSLSAPSALADQNVKLADVPAPARQTIQNEVKDGKITDIEREQDGKTVYYEVEFTAGNTDWEIAVAADGKLLRRDKD